MSAAVGNARQKVDCKITEAKVQKLMVIGLEVCMWVVTANMEIVAEKQVVKLGYILGWEVSDQAMVVRMQACNLADMLAADYIPLRVPIDVVFLQTADQVCNLGFQNFVSKLAEAVEIQLGCMNQVQQVGDLIQTVKVSTVEVIAITMVAHVIIKRVGQFQIAYLRHLSLYPYNAEAVTKRSQFTIWVFLAGVVSISALARVTAQYLGVYQQGSSSRVSMELTLAWKLVLTFSIPTTAHVWFQADSTVLQLTAVVPQSSQLEDRTSPSSF